MLLRDRDTLHRVASDLGRVRQDRKVVLTNGCFDILHAGHVATLEFARAQGDILVVAINDDQSVRRLKGDARPIVPLESRLATVAALRVVDYVTTFAEDNALAVVEVLSPEVYVKGGDYDVANTPEGRWVLEHGGTVLCAPYKPGVSTSTFLSRIKNC